MAYGARFRVVLDARLHFLREIPAGLHARLEPGGRSGIGPLHGKRHARVECEVQPALLALEDRADFQRLRVRIEPFCVPRVFEAQAEFEGDVLRLRQVETRADVEASELFADAWHVRRFHVEARFKPFGPPVRDLQRLVELVMVRVLRVPGVVRAARDEVRVELEHGLSRFDRVVRVHLDLEEILRRCGRRREHEERRTKESNHSHKGYQALFRLRPFHQISTPVTACMAIPRLTMK